MFKIISKKKLDQLRSNKRESDRQHQILGCMYNAECNRSKVYRDELKKRISKEMLELIDKSIPSATDSMSAMYYG